MEENGAALSLTNSLADSHTDSPSSRDNTAYDGQLGIWHCVNHALHNKYRLVRGVITLLARKRKPTRFQPYGERELGIR